MTFFWHRGWSSYGRDVSLACRRMIAGAFSHACVKAMRGRRPWPGLAVPVRLPPFGLSPAASRTAPSNALHARAQAAQTWQDQPRATAGGVTHSSQISSCLPSWGPSLAVRTKWEGGGWLPADGRGGGHGGVGCQACRYQSWPATQDATGKACRRDSCWRWPFEGGKGRSGNLATSKRRTGPTTRHHGTKRRGVLVHCSGADTSQRYGRTPCVRSQNVGSRGRDTRRERVRRLLVLDIKEERSARGEARCGEENDDDNGTGDEQQQQEASKQATATCVGGGPTSVTIIHLFSLPFVSCTRNFPRLSHAGRGGRGALPGATTAELSGATYDVKGRKGKAGGRQVGRWALTKDAESWAC